MVQSVDVKEASATDARGAFPIVGVGASAGGLSPTSELMRGLGAAPGIAVVIIHHLDPTHESSLVEILSRATALPVVVATDGALVEPNHVYVMPPNVGLLISRGILKLVPREEHGGLHLPINRFFESLALDCDGLAVGVVLSGTGFDGTEGIKAIKREGGITLAQDATAQYGSMPESAIATGCVDFILPPDGLARELGRLAAHGLALRETSQPVAEEQVFLKILLAMRKASGVDFTSYKSTTIRRRMERRLFFRGLSELSAYAEVLESDPAELAALCEDVLIHVTGFFRDPAAFEALRTQVFPRLCEARSAGAPIRVWVPGCSTGEEVYSIAICLLEFLSESNRDLTIKIFGTDVSAVTIERARAGRYLASIESEVSPQRLQRFFSKDERGYVIQRSVRDLCVFAKHDISRDPPFSAMDLISCRNLMIYLGPELQDRVIALLHYALNEPGYLVLGSAETVRAFMGFVAVDGKNKIYGRTSAAPRLAFDFATPRAPFAAGSGDLRASLSPDAASGARSLGQSDVHREADRLLLAEFAPPGVVVTDDLAVVQFRGRTGPFLEHAPGVATLDLLRMAREELRLPIRRAIDQARLTQGRVREAGISVWSDGQPRVVTVEIMPLSAQPTRQRFFLVLFEEVTSIAGLTQGQEVVPVQEVSHASESAVQQELASTRQYLESVIEQLEASNEELKAANEEIVSSNEELRSANEELQSAKEELQATNEELHTLNDEMRDRSLEAMRLSDDLTNVLTSVEIPILIVGRDSCLRRFTPAAGRLFGLVAADLGRLIGDAKRVDAIAPGLTRLVQEVLQHFAPAECTIQDESGRWFQLAVRPYVTLNGQIDGTVISARDVDAEKRSTDTLAAARKYAEDIVDTIRDGLLVLDGDLRVRSANKVFLRAFGLEPKEVEGRRISELGSLGLAAPALQKLVTSLDVGAIAEDFRLEQTDELGDVHAYLLNGRRIVDTTLLLLNLQDVTAIERAHAVERRAELGDILIGAIDGILIVDPAGTILFANRSAAAIFGYEGEELAGVVVDLLLSEELREIHARHRADYLAVLHPRPMGVGRALLGRRKDGALFPIEVTLNPVLRKGGPVVVAFVSDVSKQREAESRIHEYQDRLRRMSFDAVVTEERERRRIAIELHDRIGQALALAQIKVSSVREELAGDSRTAIDGAVELLEQASVDARTLVFELSPPILYDLGLKEALAWLAEDLEKRHGIKVEVTDDGADTPLDDAAKSIIFRAVRELVMNVLKHAKAPVASVSLKRIDDHLQIDVQDPGVGFEVSNALEPLSRTGFGLLSIREQITGLGGALNIESAPGRGTVASVRVPLATSQGSVPTSHDQGPIGEPT